MIEMTTGVITPENLPALIPFMSREDFLGIYPESQIRYAHTPEKGDVHYFLAPCVIEGEPCRVSLCFDREKGLTEVRFSVSVLPDEGPAEIDGVVQPVSKNWRQQDEVAVKNANDNFLIGHCGFTKKERGRGNELDKKTPFGRVRSFYDAKGCSSDIVFSYQQTAPAAAPAER